MYIQDIQFFKIDMEFISGVRGDFLYFHECSCMSLGEGRFLGPFGRGRNRPNQSGDASSP